MTTQFATQAQLQAEVARRTKQLQVENDALRIQVKRLLESERAARTMEQRLRSITNGLPLMIAYWNRHLRCEFVNEGYRHWFGLSPEQIIGMTMSDLMRDLYAEAEPHVLLALEGHAQRFERNHLCRPGDGAAVSLEIRYLPDIDDSAEVRGFISLVTDTTAYRSRE